MININSIDEMEKYYIKEVNTYAFNDDVKFEIDLDIRSNIKAWNIFAKDIKARDIYAEKIDSHNIDAHNIEATDIIANDIDACDINAIDINAKNISYYAVCIAYQQFECESVKGRKNNSVHKCLDSEIKYRQISINDDLKNIISENEKLPIKIFFCGEIDEDYPVQIGDIFDIEVKDLYLYKNTIYDDIDDIDDNSDESRDLLNIGKYICIYVG